MIKKAEPPSPYGVFMTDGHIPAHAGSDPARPFEAVLAASLYGLLKARYQPTANYAKKRPRYSVVHSWVVGQPGWQHDVGEPMASLVAGEPGDRYRLFIAGAAPSSESPDLVTGMDFILESACAMPRQHDIGADSSAAGLELLMRFADAYKANGAAPSVVLDELRLPYCFCGD